MKLKHKQAYMRTAEVFSQCSVGERLKVGAVIVKGNNIQAVGYNGLPVGIDGPLEDENGVTRPEVRHAEMNALFGVMKSNNSSIGSSVFCTHACCRKCAVEMVDAGVVEFYYQHPYRDSSGLSYLEENGVKVHRMA
ncbi:deoxycytidylate deaminase [Sinomicrobium sp.]